MLAFCAGDSTLIVDCGGDVIQRMLAAGIDLGTIQAMIITHEHPDHVAGFPLFMERIWLWGRRAAIPVYGIPAALDQARRCFEAFDTSGWDGLPEIEWHPVAHAEGALVLEDATWRVTAAPTIHSVPTIGVRVRSKERGRAVAYSCDTAPSEAIVRLAQDAALLIHEATGQGPNHASAEEAAQVAAQANAQQLVLVHLPPGLTDADLAEARTHFSRTTLGEELGSHAF